jgi:hypothetical protein
MSIAYKITEEVKDEMAQHSKIYTDHAIKRVNARVEPPANEQEFAWAVAAELGAIQAENVKRALSISWTDMFRETIEQANSSYDREFEAAMLEAIQTTHRTIQSEFWLRMLKVIDAVAKADSCYFDPRNAWTKEVCERMIFSYTHSVEVDILRNMTTEDLYRFRLGK